MFEHQRNDTNGRMTIIIRLLGLERVHHSVDDVEQICLGILSLGGTQGRFVLNR